jgi:hypothetical protein
MSNEMFKRSMWSTLGYALTDVGDDELSTREEITSILVESLSDVGAAEIEYSYTGIATESLFPEAYVFDEDGRTLRLIQIVGKPSGGPIQRFGSENVVKKICDLIGNLKEVHSASEEFRDSGADGLGEFIHLLRSRGGFIKSLELKVVILGNCDDPDELLGLPSQLQFGPTVCSISVDVYDMNKLQRMLDDKSDNGSVTVDFREFMGGPLKCLQAPLQNGTFETYLAIIPGEALATIYERYRSRILQKNLRNYLQATGKVNKGIQKSLKEKPEKFLAFNNGLTVTASSAQINENGQIEVLRDFQIVNGGQTTASLDHARRFSGTNLSEVSIQAKIVVMDIGADPTFIDDVSNYANSQNKVKMSDFASRDSFQVALATLMRDNEHLVYEWDDGNRNYWFYEAFRGGYKTELGELSGKKRRKFERNFPKSQVVDKLELAKCENGWDGYPYFVCRGNDMNFAAWIKRTKPQNRTAPDLDYCKEMVARVILWRSCLRLVKEQNFSGFRSQISAISYSYLVFLLENRNREIDLQKIWNLGRVPEEVEEEMLKVIFFVKGFLPSMSEEADPAQWAKRPNSWEKLKSMKYEGASRLVSRLASEGLLREKSVNYDLICARAIDLLEKSKLPMSRNEFLLELKMEAGQWEKFRRELLSSGDVVAVGTGPGMKYVIAT